MDDLGGNRVALFTGSMQGGGAERVLLTIATELAARGLAIDLVLMQRRANTSVWCHTMSG